MKFKRENAKALYSYFEQQQQEGNKWFAYDFDEVIEGQWDAKCFKDMMSAGEWAHEFSSGFDIVETGLISDALSHLRKMGGHIKTIEGESTDNKLNIKLMNAQNFEFLGSNLKYLGFGEKLNGNLEKNLKEQKAEFQMKVEIPHFNNKMDYTLHFKKSDSSEMYFFNRYDAKLHNGKPEDDKSQSFYLNKGSGVTAKEAFNLMEGRSVLKDLVNKDGQKYSAWVKLDFENKDEKGNAKLKQFSEQYGYNLEKTLSGFPIKELHDTEQKKNLLNSLEKGNAQQVTMSKDGKEAKYFIEAVPQFKNINVYDQKMHPVRRQNVQENYTAKTESVSEAQKPAKKQDQKADSENESSKPKQTRKRKLTV